MKTTKMITSVLISGALFTGSAIASNSGQDVEEDMINGHGMVEASPGEPYLYPNPIANELQDDQLSNPGFYAHGHPNQPVRAVAGADNHDDNGSILHVPEGS